ncbi:hypothetical protein D3C75_721680 [compost metagenome]
MLLKRSEVNQISVQIKGRHLVADDFLGIRRSLPDRPAHGLQLFLDAGRLIRNVRID